MSLDIDCLYIGAYSFVPCPTVVTRYASFDPRGKVSPNGADFSADQPRVSRIAEPLPLIIPEERPLSAQDCAIGEVIDGKYLIEGVIGRGSMGVVVRATHLGFDELVALKFIRPEMRGVDGILSRFAREAKASVRIRNEHAVNVLDVGVADPIGPFFVMEYLEGINLEELVDSQGAFEPLTAVKYVLEACEALAAAHAQGIIHRDIKPQNIFLAWQGRLELIKVLDFGISKAALRGQMFGDDLSSNERDWVMGTPLYMSPEQLRHAPDVDERTDIWSLGAVLYELLCGQPLFSGDTQTQVCRQVMEVEQRSIRVDIAGVSRELWGIIECCLSIDKAQRFSSVAELGEALLPFAPSGACLHVERARALLGLRPIDFLGFDDVIEDIDAEPIEEHEPAPAVASLTLAPAASQRPRHVRWVELALPILACAVAWIGYRQWQLSQQNVSRSDDALETVAFALTQRPACPVAPMPPPPAVAATSASPGTSAPEAEAPVEAAAPDPAASPAAVPASALRAEGTLSTTPAPTATRPAAARAAPSAERSLAQHTPAPRLAPVRRDPAPPTTPATAPLPGATEPSTEARPVRRVQKPKPEPKLQFRLIEDPPGRDFGLVPNVEGERATRSSASSP